MKYRYEPCPKCVANGKDSRGDNLVVYDSGHGHCFACGYHQFPRHYQPQLKENNVPKSLCPVDWTKDIPSKAWQWLLQYGLPYSYWQEHCGYSTEKGPRLVFQVRTDAGVAFSIGRLIPELQGSSVESGQGVARGADVSDRRQSNQVPPKPRKWYVWGDSHRHCEIVGAGKGGSIALVEDLVSAHKVGQVNECIPLFGTRVHPCHIYYLASQQKPVTLWLDKDQELNVKKQALQLQSLIDQPVRIVTTDKDPKSLSYEEINENL